MRRRTKNRVFLFGLLAVLCFLLTCGGDRTGVPSTETSNPATRPTPGFGLISGQIDLNPEDFPTLLPLEFPDTSPSSTKALHVNLSGLSDENGAVGDIMVVVTNSRGDSLSTLTNDDGTFTVRARKEVATRLAFYENGGFLASLVFGLNEAASRTTDTFLFDYETEEIGLGVISARDGWAVPEVNPLSLVDDDNDGVDDLKDIDDDNDRIPDMDETDEDGDGFIDFFSEYYDENGNLVVSFTMEGRTLRRDIELTDLDEITIIDSTIQGHVTIADSGSVFIDPTSVSSLSIADCGEVTLDELTVEADLALDTIEDLQMTSSHVKGNTTLKNIGSGTVENSEFEGEFATDDSSAIAEKENRKGTRVKAKDDGTTAEVEHGTTAEVEHTTSVEGSLDIEHKDKGGIILEQDSTLDNNTTATSDNSGNDKTHTTTHSTTVDHSVYVDSGNGPAVVDNTTTTTNSSTTDTTTTDTTTTDTSTTDTSTPGNSGGGGPPADPPGGGKKK